ncbi:DNA polymerase delta 3, accessory subunit [Phyllostomus discolor]|uniref:DNA polymerase delta subunit 3 n=1 Tax=Phyllostomus discolor TaxID=89673 RepID=A0A834A4X3_9CHIR|nr:DNA polymerase delta 3, accessory subunit [Phyllostomus discolor]
MADQIYLENIDEFVMDQNKIVTYKWLSYTLGVHVNQAKQMLYDYVERKRKENSGAQLHVTYLVSGSLVQNEHLCHKVAVVREDKLEAVKSKLAVTASVHVYSVQKAMLKDSGPLFNTDYDILKSNLQNCSKFSAIQCAAAVPRASAETSSSEKLEQSNLQASSEAQASNELTTNGYGPPSSKQISHQPKGIMGMFASKAASKTQETNKETKTEVKEVTNASLAGNKVPVKGNVMNNFFGKAAMNKLKVNLDSEPALKEEKIVEQPPLSVTEPKLAAPTGLKKSSKRAEPVKMQQEKKRGKRVELSDDETKETVSTKRKRRRVKLPESDSSEDEVTEKVYESESCTDSEEEPKMKTSSIHRPPAVTVKKEPKEERKGPKKGTAAGGKANRQVSITGFFPRK